MDANYFSNLIAAAPVQSNSRYFEKGVYLVQIDNCKVFTNRQRRPRAAVDCTVIESNNPDFPPTSQVSWVVSLDSDSGPSSVKTFICDVMECSQNEVNTGDVINKIFPFAEDPNAEASLAIGLNAIVHAHEKKTKAGGIFTKVAWKRFNAETMEKPDFRSIPLSGSNNVDLGDSETDNEGSIPF